MQFTKYTFSSQRQVGLKNAVKRRAVYLLRKQINFVNNQKLAANDYLATSGLCHNKRTTLYAQHKEILTANNGIYSSVPVNFAFHL